MAYDLRPHQDGRRHALMLPEAKGRTVEKFGQLPEHTTTQTSLHTNAQVQITFNTALVSLTFWPRFRQLLAGAGCYMANICNAGAAECMTPP